LINRPRVAPSDDRTASANPKSEHRDRERTERFLFDQDAQADPQVADERFSDHGGWSG
jgi:hypothetical protein